MDNKITIPVWIGDFLIKHLTGIVFECDVILLHCEKGREEMLFNELPLFLMTYGTITKGDSQIIIRLKN